MAAVLLFAAFTYGHNRNGDLKTSNEDTPGPYNSDKPTPANIIVLLYLIQLSHITTIEFL